MDMALRRRPVAAGALLGLETLGAPHVSPGPAQHYTLSGASGFIWVVSLGCGVRRPLLSWPLELISRALASDHLTSRFLYVTLNTEQMQL